MLPKILVNLEACNVCSEIALAVGAAVALKATSSNKASPSALCALTHLAKPGSADDAETLLLAEECIRKIQYDPFLPGSGLVAG